MNNKMTVGEFLNYFKFGTNKIEHEVLSKYQPETKITIDKAYYNSNANYLSLRVSLYYKDDSQPFIFYNYDCLTDSQFWINEFFNDLYKEPKVSQ